MALPPSYGGRDVPRFMPIPQRQGPTGGELIAEGGAALGQAAFGAQQQTLEADQRVKELNDQRVRTEQSAQGAVNFAQSRVDMAQFTTDQQAHAPPGGAGYAKAVGDEWDKRSATILNGVTNPQARIAMIGQLAEYGGSLKAQAYQWETGQQIELKQTNAKETIGKSSLLVGAATDAKAIFDEMDRSDAMIAGQELPADHAHELSRFSHASLATAAVDGAVRRGDVGFAKALLADARISDALGSDHVVNALSNVVDAKERQQEAAARAVQAQAVAAQKERLATVKAGLETGAGMPEDWEKLAGMYAAIGDTSTAVTLRAKGIEQHASLTWRSANLPEMDQRIAALQGEQIKGGLSVAHAAELNGLKDLRSQTKARLDGPGGALAQYEFATGGSAAPINFADPASVRARGEDARAAAQRYGRPAIEPLMEGDIAGLKDLANGTPSQRLQAIDRLRAFGDARTISGAAAQISKSDDGGFRIAALLPHDVAQDVLIGGETLKQHPQVWNEKLATADFSKWYGAALTRVGGGYSNDIFDAAKRFYAQRASDGHATAYDPGKFAEAIETVLGRAGNGATATGGIAHTPSGIVIVPAGMNGDTMLRSLARATPIEYARAAGGRAPRYSDGSPMGENFFKTLRPAAIADGRYGFLDRQNKFVHDDQGGTYSIDISQLPQR